MTMNGMGQQVPTLEIESDAENRVSEGSVMEQLEEAAPVREETPRQEEAPVRTAPQPKVTLQTTGGENRDSTRNKLIGAGCGIVLGVLLLTVGFWKTLLLGGLGCLGAYIFGVSDKQQSLKEFINRVFPPKD